MPTGYTTELCEKDIPFERFAMTCARAFDACVTMRDMSLSARIPDKFEPSDYHLKESEKAQASIERLLAMTTEECEAAAEKEYKKTKATYEKAKIEREELRNRLLAMRSKAADWRPPTKKHEALKKFMIEQIDETIKFDAAEWTDEAEKKTGSKWRSEHLAEAREEHKYHTDHYKKEIDDVAFGNKWLADLRESLNSGKS